MHGWSCYYYSVLFFWAQQIPAFRMDELESSSVIIFLFSHTHTIMAGDTSQPR